MIKYLYILIGLFFLIPQGVGATSYYADFSLDAATQCSQNGLATTTAFCSLDQFTEVARSAGDILFVRRGTATTTGITDLTFTSDGTIANPIIITADYDNLWSDFATSTQTYTVAVATSTFYASAAITGIAAGDWIYVAGDCSETYNSTSLNQCEFAYEVATVSGTALSLYLPYKGDQSGSGLDLRVMPDNPQWNIASGDFQWNFDTDHYWLVKGMDIRGTDVNGNVELDSSMGHEFRDSIFEGNGAGDTGIYTLDNSATFYVYKSRFFNHVSALNGVTLSDTFAYLKNVLINSNSVAASDGTRNSGSGLVFIEESELKNQVNQSIDFEGDFTSMRKWYFLRNVIEKQSYTFTTQILGNKISVEDVNGVVGANHNMSLSTASANKTLQSEVTTVRSGGSNKSIKVIPSTILSTIWDFNRLMLFEYPIYTNTVSKQYDVYFMSTSTAAWTADPLATELWIECEYWAHDTNATSTRKIKKSTGVVDFNGSTAWQALSVTCQPTQTGIMYLRGVYAKTKEASVMNEFFVDGTPIITP